MKTLATIIYWSIWLLEWLAVCSIYSALAIGLVYVAIQLGWKFWAMLGVVAAVLAFLMGLAWLYTWAEQRKDE